MYTRPSRRRFVQAAAASAMALTPSATPPARAAESMPSSLLGPMPGYSPQIGTLVSEMTWMRSAVIRATSGLSVTQLDFLLDAKANRIGALILHLAATERLYQLNTFEKYGVNDVFTSAPFKEWAVPMNLGEPARQAIKGNDLKHYLDILHETREKTLAEFKKRDDAWLMTADASFPWGPTDNLCKWFHVCEHESHHTGQISLIKSRTPGAKQENG